MNENGECLLELCEGSDLVVLNGFFPHKKVHKMTYVQRMVEGMDKEAILDYFCVSKDMKASAVNVRVKRGVEIGSNHHLVILRLDKGKVSQTSKRWTRCKKSLKSLKGKKQISLNYKGIVLREEYGSVDEWCRMKKWLLDAVEEAVAKKCGGEEKVGG